MLKNHTICQKWNEFSINHVEAYYIGADNSTTLFTGRCYSVRIIYLYSKRSYKWKKLAYSINLLGSLILKSSLLIY